MTVPVSYRFAPLRRDKDENKQPNTPFIGGFGTLGEMTQMPALARSASNDGRSERVLVYE